MFIDENYTHGGDVNNYTEVDTKILDFSVNVNPYGIPDNVRLSLKNAADLCSFYPDSGCINLLSKLKEYYGLSKECFIIGNGADELIYTFSHLLSLTGKKQKALIAGPAFEEYERALKANGVYAEYLLTREEDGFKPDKTYVNKLCDKLNDNYDALFVCTPANPTGIMFDDSDLENVVKCAKNNGTLVFLDICFYELSCGKERYIDFVKKYVDRYDNVLLVSAFTKTYAVPGVRLGYGISKNRELIIKMSHLLACWNVSVPAQIAGIECLDNEEYIKKSVETIASERKYLTESLSKLGFNVYESDSNYIFFKADAGLYKKLKDRHIIIRDCSSYYGLSKGFYRICVKLHKDNEALIDAISSFNNISNTKNRITDDGHLKNVKPIKAKAVMIQGTMSNAGKSLICTALCRIFSQDGYRVAPFKSQNMALNSFITCEGLEMGRAQAVQAEAAGKLPQACMNPVLLKPTKDQASQVIVNGQAIGNMKAKDYYEYKHKLIPEIMKAYDKLAYENDIIVIEGAGSPVELNLKEDDFVNMGLAELVDAPVIIVGDIDRGGIFAQLYGTIDLLENNEKDRVKAFIVNKFRGDLSLFDNGVTKLEKLTGRPCAGVVLYNQADIEDEDSISERLLVNSGNDNIIDIAVIRLPRMSNYTDFNALGRHRGVYVRYVSSIEEIGHPDAVIIPGTKNTIEDMKWLRETALDTAILKYNSQGGLIVGICGGLQILGLCITDMENAEVLGSINGLGILKLETTFSVEKIQKQTECTISGMEGVYESFNGCQVKGYEMHMGNSVYIGDEGSRHIISDYFIQQENVLATYIHGLFDNGLDRRFIELICSRKQLDINELVKPDTLSYSDYRNLQYNMLADSVRSNLDMELIYKILGLHNDKQDENME